MTPVPRKITGEDVVETSGAIDARSDITTPSAFIFQRHLYGDLRFGFLRPLPPQVMFWTFSHKESPSFEEALTKSSWPKTI